MIKQLAIVLVSMFTALVFILGWEKEVFVFHVLSLFSDKGITINQVIPEPKKHSVSHLVLWKGDIENKSLSESSGLTASTRREGLLWSVNDSGSEPEVFALSANGAHLGKWRIAGIEPNDWEGMDSFRFNDRHYLLIGDTGDNFRLRTEVSFLVIEEPNLGEGASELEVSWQTYFRFPDGPKDVEAVAIDLKGKRVLFLNKRELPLRLYSVPLFPVDRKLVARKMAELVPVPRYRSDLEDLYGESARYLGLPTGMDLFENKLLVATYRNAYLYDFKKLGSPPEELALPFIGQREAITFGFESTKVAYFSRERKKGKEVADIFEIRFTD